MKNIFSLHWSFFGDSKPRMDSQQSYTTDCKAGGVKLSNSFLLQRQEENKRTSVLALEGNEHTYKSDFVQMYMRVFQCV